MRLQPANGSMWMRWVVSVDKNYFGHRRLLKLKHSCLASSPSATSERRNPKSRRFPLQSKVTILAINRLYITAISLAQIRVWVLSQLAFPANILRKRPSPKNQWLQVQAQVIFLPATRLFIPVMSLPLLRVTALSQLVSQVHFLQRPAKPTRIIVQK